MVQMKTKIVPTKILKQYLYYLKYHHIEINEFHNDHIYNKDVNITSDPYLCSYNDECLNKDFSLDDYIDFSVSVSDSINNFEVCHTCDFCSFFDTWLTTNNSLFFDTDTSFLVTVYLKI